MRNIRYSALWKQVYAATIENEKWKRREYAKKQRQEIDKVIVEHFRDRARKYKGKGDEGQRARWRELSEEMEKRLEQLERRIFFLYIEGGIPQEDLDEAVEAFKLSVENYSYYQRGREDWLDYRLPYNFKEQLRTREKKKREDEKLRKEIDEEARIIDIGDTLRPYEEPVEEKPFGALKDDILLTTMYLKDKYEKMYMNSLGEERMRYQDLVVKLNKFIDRYQRMHYEDRKMLHDWNDLSEAEMLRKIEELLGQ